MSPRLWDFAYLAYRLVPYAEDADGFDPELFGRPRDRLRMLTDAYGTEIDPAEVMAVMARRLDELADFSEQRAAETGRRDLLAHAAMYRRDAHAAAKGLFK